MILDPVCHQRADIIAKPLNSASGKLDKTTMHHHNHESQDSPLTMMAATIVLFVAFVALCTGCSSGAGAPAPEDPTSPPPCYSADEPANDSFLTTEPIPATAERFMVEGYIHHSDLDCMIVLPLTAIAGRGVTATFDYAYGWDMDVSLGYRDALGIRRTLHAEYDAWGTGVGTFLEEFPAEAVDVTLSIGQRTLNYIPDSTRYTIEVEIF
jgi:hypothetical protein